MRAARWRAEVDCPDPEIRQFYLAEQRKRRKREREKRRYEYLRDTLIAKLGGRCAKCRGRMKLQVDHVRGRTWDVNAVNCRTRYKRYWQEYEAGVELRVLCIRCNANYRPAQTP